MPRRKPRHTLLSTGASLIGMGLIFLLLPAMLGTRPVMNAVGEGLRMPGWSALGVGVVLLALHWLVRQRRGNWGQIKIYKQALSLHLIATYLIAVRAYQSSATAFFDYSS